MLRYFPLVFPVFLLGQRDIPVELLIERYAPPPSQFFFVMDMNVHLRDEGEGPVLMLLHGMCSSLHTWDGWVAALEDSFRLIRMDLPGFGLTGPHSEDEYSLSGYVTFLDALMDSLGVDTFTLAGNSMGGGIAWEYSLVHPERVTALILIDAIGYPRIRPPLAIRLGRIPLIRWLFRYVTPRFVVARTLKSAYGDKSRISRQLVKRYHALLLREGNRRGILKILKQDYPDGSQRIPRIRVPAMIMWGAKDAWIPVEHAHRFARDLPGARLVIYPDAGHVPMEEIPARSAIDARLFLQEMPSAD